MHTARGPFFLATMLMAAVITSAPATALSGEGNTRIVSFNKAKKILEQKVYFDQRVTLYCGAPYDTNNNINLPAGFHAPKHEKRSARIEWEHMVPAENFGRSFTEWREGDARCVDNRGKAFKGRKCAEKVNIQYRYMQSDMYNLAPAIGSVNAMRGNKRYSELPGMSATFGTCEAKVDKDRFEPPAKAKGEVARAGLYMADAYSEYRLSKQQRQLFEAWDKMYSVTAWECTRAKRIERIQGNANKFVKTPCVEKGLW